MIRKVVIRRFKRFEETTFEFPGHVVIAGPNNTGKTTVLQAIAAWSFSYQQWKTLNDFNPRNGYVQKPIARQAFSAVPLRSFDFLWRGKSTNRNIEIEVESIDGRSLAMELRRDSTEQIYVRPSSGVDPHDAESFELDVAFIPPMTGLSIDEPEYKPAKIDQLLGQAKPGEVLRNLLLNAKNWDKSWTALQESIHRLFGYELVPPDSTGPNIIAEFRTEPGGPTYDIAGAGSGFQQVLMLLAFLNTRSGSVLLVDEPDAHLHIILQDAIWSELKRVAEREYSQLIIATHSEVIINSVEPRDLCVLLDQPRRVTDEQQRQIVADSLRILSNTDIMLALDSPGILYLEGVTDLNILKEWARILKHPLYKVLNSRSLLWKEKIADSRLKGSGIKSVDHYKALCLAKPDLPAVELIDRDGNDQLRSSEITGRGYQKLVWNRYEIESYLVHPTALSRFVQMATGSAPNGAYAKDLQKHFEDYPTPFLANPFLDLPFIKNTKARTELLPPALTAGGLPAVPYKDYYKIAALMEPNEIHPEVKEKLDLIQKAFGL